MSNELEQLKFKLEKNYWDLETFKIQFLMCTADTESGGTTSSFNSFFVGAFFAVLENKKNVIFLIII